MATKISKTTTKAKTVKTGGKRKKLLKRVESSLKFQGSYSSDIAKLVTNF